MSLKTFAMVAIFGASVASAANYEEYCAPTKNLLPVEFDELDWKAKAVAMHSYMDACPQDGVVSFIELDRYYGEIEDKAPLVHEYNHGIDVYEAFVRLDDDGDMQVSQEEFLRHALIESGEIFIAGPDAYFTYLTCRPRADGSSSPTCEQSFRRADLRAMAPMYLDLTGVYVDDATLKENIVAYERYISREMYLRDYN